MPARTLLTCLFAGGDAGGGCCEQLCVQAHQSHHPAHRPRRVPVQGGRGGAGRGKHWRLSRGIIAHLGGALWQLGVSVRSVSVRCKQHWEQWLLYCSGLIPQVDDTIYASDANSTAYKYPLADAALLRVKGKPAGEWRSVQRCTGRGKGGGCMASS